MFNSYWNTASYYGYNPFAPVVNPAQAFPQVVGSSGSCYNPHVRSNNYTPVYQPATPEMKASIEELRNYVMALESSRKLDDLSDVEFTREVQVGDILYRTSENKWQLTNYLTGGEW